MLRGCGTDGLWPPTELLLPPSAGGSETQLSSIPPNRLTNQLKKATESLSFDFLCASGVLIPTRTKTGYNRQYGNARYSRPAARV